MWGAYMEYIKNFFDWMKNNKVWVFSCIGIIIVLFIITKTSSKESMTDMDMTPKEMNNIEVSDDADHTLLTNEKLSTSIFSLLRVRFCPRPVPQQKTEGYTLIS